MKNKLELTLLARTVTIDIEKISKGLADVHNENKSMRTALKFGMLDARLMMHTEQELEKNIRAEFGERICSYVGDKPISSFVAECNHAIVVGIFNKTEMVV